MKRANEILFGAILVAASLAACTETVEVRRTPVERGEELVTTTKASPSSTNAYACTTCHLLGGTSSDLLPGASLGGVTGRTVFWGGSEPDLLRAINHCRSFFMGAVVPWKETDDDALSVLSFLETLPGDTAPVPFTVTFTPADVPKGDAALGDPLYARACALCHGSAHTGAGRLTKRAPILPEETLKAHETYSPFDQRLVFVEKVRHGTFLGYGGEMPPFSKEVLGDADLGHVLSYLGLDVQ